jgi:hypothetical protein
VGHRQTTAVRVVNLALALAPQVPKYLLTAPAVVTWAIPA